MKGVGLIAILLALGVGYYMYSQQMTSLSPFGGGPRATIDMIGVRADLMTFASAERQQFALEGRYLSIEDLRARGMVVPEDSRGPYNYSAEISANDFRIVATYSGPEDSELPASLSIGPSMQIE